MRLSERVYLIASGRLGCFLTHPADCNVYAIDCGGPVFLVDSGVGVATNQLIENLGKDGVDRARLHALLLTHGHLDHSGGAAHLHAELKLPVWSSVETAQALEAADEEAISLAEAKRAGIYEPSFPFHACPVEKRLTGGECIAIGDSTLRAIRTPGHSHDLLSFLFETPDGLLAFPGDTVFHGGRILIQSTWDCDPQAYSKSLRELAAHKIDGLFPGHGMWSLRQGSEQVRACLPYLDKLLLPPNLV